MFVLVPPQEEVRLAPLSGIYQWALARGYQTDAEHVMIEGVPVQFIPAPDELATAAIRCAREADYEGVNVRVIDPEHLIALALQAGGARRRERAWLLLRGGNVDRPRLRGILKAHQIAATIPDDV